MVLPLKQPLEIYTACLTFKALLKNKTKHNFLSGQGNLQLYKYIPLWSLTGKTGVYIWRSFLLLALR